MRLPDTISHLCHKLVDKLLTQPLRVDVRYPAQAPDTDGLHRILERVALKLLVEKESQLTFTPGELEQALSEALAETGYGDAPASWLNAFRVDFTQNSGILRGSSEQGYFFLHPLIQYCLGADALARVASGHEQGWNAEVRVGGKNWKLCDLVEKSGRSSSWREVLMFLSGQVRDPWPLLQLVAVEKGGDHLPRFASEYVRRVRVSLLEQHQAGASGREVVESYTRAIDHLIRHLFDVASQDYIRRYPRPDLRLTLIAQGGYGRGELNPNSDIDLLFLYPRKITPYVESVAEKVLYALWDAGFQVGHAMRTIEESIRLARKDMKVMTSLLDTRYLRGDHTLYVDFEETVERRLLGRNVHRFIREQLEVSRLRHERYGGSVYVLDPDVKEGAGGLRDIHTVLWVAKMRYKIKDLDALVGLGVIRPGDLAELKDSQDFLWRVRNELHFFSGKDHDQLTREDQEGVARSLGFRDDARGKGVEAFMRNYYFHALQINRLTSLIIHWATDASKRR